MGPFSFMRANQTWHKIYQINRMRTCCKYEQGSSIIPTPMMGGDLFIVTYIFHRLAPGKCNLTFSWQDVENVILHFPGANMPEIGLDRRVSYIN